MHKFSEQVYAKHGKIISNYLEKKVLPAILTKGLEAGGVPLLEELKFRWENHTVMNKWLCKVFDILNRSKIVRVNGLPRLNVVELTAFKKHIYEHVKVCAKDAVIELIDKERDGEMINKDLIQNAVKFYEAMGKDDSISAYNEDLVSCFSLFFL